MKIRYKKSRNTFYLLMIVFWIALIIYSSMFGEFGKWTDYLVIAVGVMYVSFYSYNYLHQYLTLEKDSIKLNFIFSRKIFLSDIKEFKKFAGEYILRTDSDELRINTSLIDETSLKELNKVLTSLKLN